MSIYDLAKEVTYNPDTGEFTWKNSSFGRKSGAIAGGLNRNGYCRISYNHKKYMAHRLAFVCMGEEIPALVDHKNGIKNDNRWSNLRPANSTQNAVNSKKGSGFSSNSKGVYYTRYRTKPWKVELGKDGKSIYFGYYKTEEEATKVAKQKYRELHGKFSPYERKIDEEI